MTGSYVALLIDDLTRRLPDCEPGLIRAYAQLALVRGVDTMLEDVHDAWAVHRHAGNPFHPDLVPFDQLSAEAREKDRVFMEAIHASARAVLS